MRNDTQVALWPPHGCVCTQDWQVQRATYDGGYLGGRWFTHTESSHCFLHELFLYLSCVDGMSGCQK